MRVAVDTNILVHAEGLNGAAKANVARAVLSRVLAEAYLPVQVAAEFYNVLTLKAGLPRAEAGEIVAALVETTRPLPTSDAVLMDAIALASRSSLRVFDCIILAAAAAADCAVLVSEDMQDGFVHRGVTVVDPFAATPHPLLTSLLET